MLDEDIRILARTSSPRMQIFEVQNFNKTIFFYNTEFALIMFRPNLSILSKCLYNTESFSVCQISPQDVVGYLKFLCLSIFL